MFATALRTSIPNVASPASTLRITKTQQFYLVLSAVAAPSAILFGAPRWAPRFGDRADRFFERMAERMERMPKFKKLGIRVPIRGMGSVGI
ncbi:hypothetical protein CAC42_746 [Sphaceloma murrayae]|uniref:Uncharacterized protein n=1 Tax=Sphaceloma murrayae TaxID=2082308 RepID=A0A2K1QK45_9PEZI|nr:hypothetical protein CAC42_746 [Sphaceloma murrayae]